ncbi:MAG: DUF2029 domain-containing protein [Cyanobacteria bacterium SZAS LIN-5]|nr:DUF2029 domain-containing protein [Cyanobacteria bacterium SZAS LIN-5]
MSNVSNKRVSKLEVALPYCFSLVLLVVVGILLSAPHLALKDMPEFYAPGRFLLSGNPSAIYKPEVFQPFVRDLFPEHEAPILYIPPYGLPMLAPLGFLPASLADPVWFAFLVLCSFASVIILKLLLNLEHKYVMRICGLLCLSGPEWEAIRHGQLAPLLLLSLCLGLYFLARGVANSFNKQRFFDGNVAAALALTPLLAKPQLIIPVVVFLAGAGRFKVLAFLAGIGLLLNVVAVSLFGSSTYIAYFDLLQRVKENRVWQAPEVTPTIRGQLLRMLPDSESMVMWVSGAALVGAMVWIFLIARKYRRSPLWYEYLVLGALPLGLFTALHCHNYDLLLLLPTVVVYMFGASTQSVPLKRKLLCLIAIVPLMMPIYNKIHYEYLLVGGRINLLFLDLFAVAVASVVWLQFGKQESELDSGAEPG